MNRREMQNNLAMNMVLISGSMLFATLLMGYSLFRSSSATWPPEGIRAISLGYPLLSTATILLSSWFCSRIRGNLSLNDFRSAKMNLNTTVILGVLFMIIQSLLWIEMKSTGLFVGSGIFSSVVYGFTWIHAAHMISGLLVLGWLRFVLRPHTVNLSQKVLNVEKFWHFLGVIWFILFISLFVI
jgi:cytochrome c oxidase subunit III